jgi:uncharacterized protein
MTIAPPTAARVDSEVHSIIGYDRLAEDLDPRWSEHVWASGYRGPGGASKPYPPKVPTSVGDSWRNEGTVPGATIATLREQVFDDGRCDFAIIVPSLAFDIDQIWHPQMAVAYAQAANDWTIGMWLDREPRVRGSIVLPARDVSAMVDEIERVADHPGFVQVVLPVRSESPYGSPNFQPVLAAATRHSLAVALHPGGFPGNPPTPVGWPSYHIEEVAGLTPLFTTQLTSLISNGAFQRLPELRLVLLETGFTWLPPFLWRFDQEWRGLRREVPWLKSPPSEYIREHVRVTTQPLDAGSSEAALRAFEWLESDDMVLYASDYPHGHGQNQEVFLDALDEDAKANILGLNARAFYALG